MKLSRILLPIVWPMVAVFALGAAVGVAVPQSRTEGAPRVSETSGPAGESASDAPQADTEEGGKKDASGPDAEESSEAEPERSPAASATPSATPSTSPASGSLCTDSADVIVLAIAAPEAAPLDVGDVFDAAGPVASVAASEAAQLKTTVSQLIKRKKDVVLLVSGTIALDLVNAIREATVETRAWVVVGEEERGAWAAVFEGSTLGGGVYKGEVSNVERLTTWATVKLPCLFVV